MARLAEPTPEQEAGWKEWVASRPNNVRAIAERFDPWSLYRMKETGHRCTLYSFGETDDGRVTVTVNVTGEHNFVAFDRQVFGVDPDSLEPCDPPTDDEVTGTMLTEEDEIEAFVDATRPVILSNRDHS